MTSGGINFILGHRHWRKAMFRQSPETLVCYGASLTIHGAVLGAALCIVPAPAPAPVPVEVNARFEEAPADIAVSPPPAPRRVPSAARRMPAATQAVVRAPKPPKSPMSELVIPAEPRVLTVFVPLLPDLLAAEEELPAPKEPTVATRRLPVRLATAAHTPVPPKLPLPHLAVAAESRLWNIITPIPPLQMPVDEESADGKQLTDAAPSSAGGTLSTNVVGTTVVARSTLGAFSAMAVAPASGATHAGASNGGSGEVAVAEVSGSPTPGNGGGSGEGADEGGMLGGQGTGADFAGGSRGLPQYRSTPRPAYPALARANGWEGRSLLRLEVGADGKVRQVELLHSSGYSVLDQAALRAAERWRFTPAQRDGRAVACYIEVPVRFELQKP